jgi:DNA-binding PadR family transcriptional regulator
VLREFFQGFVKIHVLHHAAHGPVYGLAMIEELRRHGYDIGPGTLYPMLHALARDGYLAREERVVGGRVRKYYVATDAGRRVLEQTREKIAALVDEVVHGRGPTVLPAPPTDRGGR